MSIIDDHIVAKTEEVKTLVSYVSNVLNELNPGQKVLITRICKDIAEKTGKDYSKIYQIITFFLEDCPGIVRKHGRNGGTYKL